MGTNPAGTIFSENNQFRSPPTFFFVKRFLKYVFLSILGLLLLVLVAVGVIGFTPVGERFVTAQVNRYLAKKIKSPFRVGRIKYRIPDWILLENVLVKTPKGDTLLSGGLMRVDLDMLGLLQSRVAINQVELAKMRVNITRTLPDTAFNFNFLIDAFTADEPSAKPKKTTVNTTAAPLDIALTGLALRDVGITYHDDVAGAEVRAAVDTLGVKFDAADVSRSRYHVGTVFLNGLRTDTRLYAGLPTPPSATKSAPLDLRIGTWNLRRIRWNVAVETAHFRTTGDVPSLKLVGRQLSLDGQRVALDTFDLRNADLAFVLGAGKNDKTPVLGEKMASPSSKPNRPADRNEPRGGPQPTTNNQQRTTNNTGWQATLSRLFLQNNRIRFDDATQPRQPKGLDYAHLDLRDLTLNGQGIVYQPGRIAARVRGGAFRAASGLTLRRLDGDAEYTDRRVAVKNLLLQTPRTLLRDGLQLTYDSLAQLSNPRFARRVGVDVTLRQSQLAVADLLQLVPTLAKTPPFAGNENGLIRANARLTGTLAALNVPTFELALLEGTRLKASGRLTNVTDPQRIGMDLAFREATTSRADLLKLVPKGALPGTVDVPPNLSLAGRARGALNDLTLDVKATTAWGTAAFDGRLKNFVAGKGQTYNGTATLTGFDAGKWLKQPKQLGKITGTATVNGRGLDVKTMQTDFRLAVTEATLNGYRYQNFAASGTLAGGTLDVRGGIDDPNARLRLDTRVGLLGAYPSVQGEVAITEVDFQKLGFYKEPLLLRGQIDLAMLSTDPKRPVGTIRARDAALTLKGKTYPIDSLFLRANAEGGRKSVVARVPFGQLALNGQFEYTRLYDILVGEVRRYFDVPQLTYTRVPPPYDFDIQAKIYQDSLLRAFVPLLTRLDTVRLAASLDNTRDTTLSATLTTGVVEYDTTTLSGSALSLRAVNNQLRLNGRVNSVATKSLRAGPTLLTGTAARNALQFRIINKDSVNQDRYGLAGRLQVSGETYRLSLARNGLLTNYQRWVADTAGFVQYGPEGIRAERFIVYFEGDSGKTASPNRGLQMISVNSNDPSPQAPLRVDLLDLNLASLARLAGQDTSLANGTLNGTVYLRDVLTNLSFTGYLNAAGLRVMKQPLGNLNARFEDQSDRRIRVDATLAGPYNDARIAGFYNAKSPDAPLDVTVDLRRLDARTVEAFSFGQLRQAAGQLTGQVRVTGAATQPRMDGSIAFDSVAFTVAQNNARYRIDQETIRFSGSTITFDQFDLLDTLGRKLTTDGTVTLANLPDVGYDLRVNGQNFMVLNATRRDNDYAYGNAAVSLNLRIRGNGGNPSISGSVKLDEGSKVTVVLPDQGPGANEARKVVTFIDHRDTLALRKYLIQPRRDTTLPKLAFDNLTNTRVALTVTADDKSELILVVDELAGDNLRVRGNADLNVSLGADGSVQVLGRYDITDGSYSLTYQVLTRSFKLQKGGYIQFTGDPLRANVNLTAVYETNTAPENLVQNEIAGSATGSASVYKVKLPFQVLLSMEGSLANPTLRFDIQLDETSNRLPSTDVVNTVKGKLSQLRQDPAQINKQVFALLLLNGFIPDDPSAFFSGGGGGGTALAAENIARSSVSKILSQQLENFASSVLKGFNVNVDLQSSNDYVASGNTAQRGGRTDLNVGLSRSFLDGRLSVTVGRNFVLENSTGLGRNPQEVFDNVSLQYNLSRDGRYALRGYRQNRFDNQLTAVVDGYVIETGVAFVITMDYNLLREVFRKRKENEKGLF